MTQKVPDKTPTPSEPPTWFELHWKGLLFAVLGMLTFAGLFIFVSQTKVESGKAATTATAMLAVITATAIGIERAIETFWSLVGQLSHGWWPFNKMFTEVSELEEDVKQRLGDAQKSIEDKLATAANLSKKTQDGLKMAQEEIKKLDDRITGLKELAPGNQRVSLIAASVSQSMGMVAQYKPEIDYNLRLVDQSVAGLTDFAASFKENPLRRIVNIWAGAMLGMAVAYFVRFDVFYAVLGEASQPSDWWPNLGIALTGLIVGLGSNPTHDVIAALQEVKKYRAGQNAPGPIVSEPVSGAAVEEPEESPEGEEMPPPGAMGLVPPPAQKRPAARQAPPVRRFR